MVEEKLVCGNEVGMKLEGSFGSFSVIRDSLSGGSGKMRWWEGERNFFLENQGGGEGDDEENQGGFLL